MTVDQLIRSYLREEGKLTLHGYNLYREYLFDGYRDMGWDTQVPVATKLDVPADKMVNLPSWVTKVVRVGFLDDKSEFIPIQKNNNLSRVDVDSCGNPINSEILYSFEPPSPIASHFRNGLNIGGYYGKGSKPTFGSYKLWPSGLMQLSSDFTFQEVYVECLANITDTTPDFEIPEHLIEPLKNWIEYSSKRRKRNAPRGLIQDLYRVYVHSKNIALRRYQGFSMADAVAASRKGIRQSPKM